MGRYILVLILSLVGNSLCFSVPQLLTKIDSLITKAEYFKRVLPDSALPYYLEVIDITKSAISKSTEEKEIVLLTDRYAKALAGAGRIYYHQGKLSEALEKYLLSYTLYQKIGNADRLAYLHICLGQTYRNYGPEMFLKAIKEIRMADSLYRKSGNTKGVSNAYIELGWLYGDYISQVTYDLDTALLYFNKAWDLMKNSGDESQLVEINLGQAWILSKLGRYREALIKSGFVLKYYERNQSVGGLCDTYFTIGDIHYLSGNYNESIRNLNNALILAQKTNNLDKENNILELLSSCYYELKDYKNAFDYFNLSVQKKFQMLSSEKISVIEEMKAKYESEKKELQITNLNNKKKLQSSIIIFQTIGISLLVVLLIISVRFYMTKKSDNSKLQQQNAEINQQKEEIVTQRDEIEAQRDIVISQKLHIEKIHKELTSSIDYARQIQNTLLPSPALLKDLFPNHFILFKPRDIVSGDFYWAIRMNHQIAFCVSDCTGHGVPGSLMSMLGISFLNEIVSNLKDLKANHILNLLRSNLVTALQQKGIKGEQKDGMEMALCIINTETLELQFSGALNPCWVIKNVPDLSLKENSDLKFFWSSPETKTGMQMIELIPNRMPVSIHLHMDPFTTTTIQLQKNDLIYLLSDGYADQTGGPDNKKIQSRNIRELLFDHFDNHMDDQKFVMDEFFEKWKGNNEQVDDVTLMGIKI